MNAKNVLELLVTTAVLCASMSTGLGVCPGSLSTKSSYFRLVRRDSRKCVSPRCGGYFVRMVNNNNKDMYVGNIQLGHLGPNVLQPFNALTRTLPDRLDLVLFRGALVNAGNNFCIQDLKVTNVYLGYPGVNVALRPWLHYYHIGKSVAVPLNAGSRLGVVNGKIVPVNTYNESANVLEQYSGIDEGVQRDQILHKGALVIASIQAPSIFIKQVYFRLPVLHGPCPLVPRPSCGTDRLVYRRNLNFCFIPSCKKAFWICAMVLPRCPRGYKVIGWTSVLSGCGYFTCDPVFFPTRTLISI